jgi:phosphatidylglycerol---prolipoprotein diacylglyceryl transferase
MQQVLFHLPFTQGWFGMPDGLPLYGFGAMLFFCFILAAMVWGPRRGIKIGLPKDRLQDMAIVIFLTGIAGARIFYMSQYPKEFEGRNKLLAFFEIWNGGIVFYGSVLGAVLGYTLFYFLVLRKLRISTWKLADVVAPLIALGLAIGRIGCYLNGCCWGQVACPESQPMPLQTPALGQFPILSAHFRDQLVRPASANDRLPHIRGLQTSAGFSVRPVEAGTVVVAVEPGSAAALAGVLPGDRILEVNGVTNAPNAFGDHFDTMIHEWPRGKQKLDLVIERGSTKVPLSFIPRTVTFFPTQLYESISMVLLIAVLLTFQPFRRHDGQVMVLFMVGYAIHRFLNEAIRIEPTYELGLTVSQWISVCILVAAIGLEFYLRFSQTRLPKGVQPLGA